LLLTLPGRKGAVIIFFYPEHKAKRNIKLFVKLRNDTSYDGGNDGDHEERVRPWPGVPRLRLPLRPAMRLLQTLTRHKGEMCSGRCKYRIDDNDISLIRWKSGVSQKSL
jgi:hypothetical protein